MNLLLICDRFVSLKNSLASQRQARLSGQTPSAIDDFPFTKLPQSTLHGLHTCFTYFSHISTNNDEQPAKVLGPAMHFRRSLLHLAGLSRESSDYNEEKALFEDDFHDFSQVPPPQDEGQAAARILLLMASLLFAESSDKDTADPLRFRFSGPALIIRKCGVFLEETHNFCRLVEDSLLSAAPFLGTQSVAAASCLTPDEPQENLDDSVVGDNSVEVRAEAAATAAISMLQFHRGDALMPPASISSENQQPNYRAHSDHLTASFVRDIDLCSSRLLRVTQDLQSTFRALSSAQVERISNTELKQRVEVMSRLLHLNTNNDDDRMVPDREIHRLPPACLDFESRDLIVSVVLSDAACCLEGSVASQFFNFAKQRLEQLCHSSSEVLRKKVASFEGTDDRHSLRPNLTPNTFWSLVETNILAPFHHLWHTVWSSRRDSVRQEALYLTDEAIVIANKLSQKLVPPTDDTPNNRISNHLSPSEASNARKRWSSVKDKLITSVSTAPLTQPEVIPGKPERSVLEKCISQWQVSRKSTSMKPRVANDGEKKATPEEVTKLPPGAILLRTSPAGTKPAEDLSVEEVTRLELATIAQSRGQRDQMKANIFTSSPNFFPSTPNIVVKETSNALKRLQKTLRISEITSELKTQDRCGPVAERGLRHEPTFPVPEIDWGSTVTATPNFVDGSMSYSVGEGNSRKIGSALKLPLCAIDGVGESNFPGKRGATTTHPSGTISEAFRQRQLRNSGAHVGAAADAACGAASVTKLVLLNRPRTLSPSRIKGVAFQESPDHVPTREI